VSAESDLYFRQIAVGQMANFAYLVGSRTTREALLKVLERVDVLLVNDGEARVDLLGVVEVLHEHLTAALCEIV